MSGGAVHDSHQRMVGRILKIIAVSGSLRQSVELRTGNRVVRVSPSHF